MVWQEKACALPTPIVQRLCQSRLDQQSHIIARLPGTIPQGAINDSICNLIDLGPTIVDMAGAPPMPATDGRSLWPQLCGQEDPIWTDETFSEHLWESNEVPSRMIRSGPWKLYKYNEPTPPALFNLENDPKELNDLGNDTRHQDIKDTLLQRLYKDWNPAYILEETANLDRDYRLISSWGQTVQPIHEDAVPVPDVENIELI